MLICLVNKLASIHGLLPFLFPDKLDILFFVSEYITYEDMKGGINNGKKERCHDRKRTISL